METQDIDREKLSAKLKKLIGGKSMTKIAMAIGIGDASFRSYVNGKTTPSATALAAIAKYFQIPVAELTGSSETQDDAVESVKKTLKELSTEEKKQVVRWLMDESF